MFKTISIREVDYYIDGGYDMALIDLRDAHSYERAHLKGAVNIPYEELWNRVSFLPKEKLLVFYCIRGGLSLMACRRLDLLGYSVMGIVSGLSDYRGKYLVREKAGEGR